MANSIIDTKNISFKYGDDYAIEDISFHVDQGDYVGLIGPNGSGKTTLVKILLGLLKPQKGTVELFGQESSKFIDRYKIGYVAQKSHQKDQEIPISVEEVVLEGRVPRRGIGKSFTKSDFEKAHSALKHVSMLANKERKIAELSGGQRQRVLIARALAADAQLLVLDEPTAGTPEATSRPSARTST
jgi:zinc transport system ATP-binding protein